VRAGERVAAVASLELQAPLSGRVRGITRDGVQVTCGTKVFEVDPRGTDAAVHGIGERPRRIAAAVVDAVAATVRPSRCF
jgi:xanthine dehydrogenase accessory factor